MSDFAASIERLLHQVHHWDERRWSAPLPAGPAATTGGPAATKAELVRGLAQTLADLSAEAEQRPARELPRLHDLVLPDQLRVLTDDLLAADPPAGLLARAAVAVDEARRSL